MNAWPHQSRSIALLDEAIQGGEKSMCLYLPTGMGKTRVMQDLAVAYVNAGKKVSLYTNRKNLIEQTSAAMDRAKINHGIRAAGYPDQRELPFQISSFQTESRRLKNAVPDDPEFPGGTLGWTLHAADLVLIDEAHENCHDTAEEIIRRHLAAGAVVVGFSATPCDVAHVYNSLIVGGNVSDGFACGALVRAEHVGAGEPDFKAFKKKMRECEELTEPQMRKIMNVEAIYGDVIKWYRQLNPQGIPAVLFAPGIRESIFFAEEFTKAGIPASHIDGDDCWIDGHMHKASPNIREELRERSKSGDIKIVCNRYVMRTGVDWPWLSHAVFATPFGSLQAYIQSGGRILRAYPGKTRAVIQDHGGAWIRFGSLNADREWRIDLTGNQLAAVRERRLREKKDREPARCPQCGLINMGKKCSGCGFTIDLTKRPRPVYQEDGSIEIYTGDIFEPRIAKRFNNTQSLWEAQYWRACNTRWDVDGEDLSGRKVIAMAERISGQKYKGPQGAARAADELRHAGHTVVLTKPGRNFNQAEAQFFLDHHYWPPRDLRLMPKSDYHFSRHVAAVPMEELL